MARKVELETRRDSVYKPLKKKSRKNFFLKKNTCLGMIASVAVYYDLEWPSQAVLLAVSAIRPY